MIAVFLAAAIFAAGSAAGYGYRRYHPEPSPSEEKDIYRAFIAEVYDQIQTHYWSRIDDAELTSLFFLAATEITGGVPPLETNDREHWETRLEAVLKRLESEEAKKEFVTRLADLVLANLKPFGRSRLYLQEDEESLRQRVANIHPGADHYQALGLEKGAAAAEIETAYREKTGELMPQVGTSEEAESEFRRVESAHRVLGDSESRQLYDETGAEPTVDGQLVRPEILHLRITNFSPLTLEELKRATEKFDQGDALDTLIFDLRGNVGGAIDTLPYFLGPFIGQDQYAYQFLSQGEKTDYKTKVGWLPSLVRYKKVVVLVDGGCQSSIEIVASVLKKYNVGVVLGTKTRGWGTVEKVFPLQNQLGDDKRYSIFLVHSLTLREDGQPIEGNGVEPLINIEDSNWESQLLAHFNYPELVEVIKEIWGN